MVEYSDASAIKRLQEIGTVTFRSKYAPWVVVAADEGAEKRIAEVPGVKQVYRARQGEPFGR